MKSFHGLTVVGLLTSGLLVVSSAQATNGYFAHGIGLQSQALGGVGVVLPESSLAIGANPAAATALGARADLGLSLFEPRRSATIRGNAFGADATYDGNARRHFVLPEAGWVQPLRSDLSAGLALYGNGGMNTDYSVNPYQRFGATGSAGVNLSQVFIAPTLAWRPVAGQSIGVSLNVAVQRFSAKGLGLFAGFSADPQHVSDQGTDTSVGAGLKVGWLGEVAQGVSLGASWASKIHGRFDRYRGLFADQGGFDIPSNWALGAAWQVVPATALAAEVQRIGYGDVGSVANPLGLLLQGRALGSSGGPGFGWQDVTVYKLGLQQRVSADWVLRAGFSRTGQPVPADQTFFNILAPGVVQKHYTAGASWRTPWGGELTGTWAHASRRTVQGSGSIPPGFPPGGFGGGEADVRLKEDIIGIAYGWKL